MDEQIGFIEDKIAAFNNERVRLLMTMLGLDYFSASLLGVEICNINRFSSDKKFVSWLFGKLPCEASAPVFSIIKTILRL